MKARKGKQRLNRKSGAQLHKSKALKRLHVYWSDKLQKMLVLNQRLPSSAYYE
jgi:hypothetical protein